jgi:hypothetical protein
MLAKISQYQDPLPWRIPLATRRAQMMLCDRCTGRCAHDYSPSIDLLIRCVPNGAEGGVEASLTRRPQGFCSVCI